MIGTEPLPGLPLQTDEMLLVDRVGSSATDPREAEGQGGCEVLSRWCYVYIYIYIYIYIYDIIYIYIYITIMLLNRIEYVCIYIYTHIHIHTYIYIYVSAIPSMPSGIAD